jgi:Glycosyltransferase family 87
MSPRRRHAHEGSRLTALRATVTGLATDPDRRVDLPWLADAFARTAPVVLLLVPLVGLVKAFRDDILAYDFNQAFLPAAERLLDGDSPYPELGYPPLVAFLSVPFVVAPATDVLVTVAVAACVPASLWLLGVRDWRCYVVAFLWAPVFHAVQTANVTLPILFAAAVCWRWRESVPITSVAGGLAVASKIIGWPLAVWLAFTRRVRAALGVLVVAVGVTLTLWAAVGFSGLFSYPDSLDNTQSTYSEEGYTFRALALDAGLPARLGFFASLAVLALVLAGVALYGRRGDDMRSFACAAVAVIVTSPIIWLHSFALLLAPVALLRPRLSVVWFMPVLLALVSEGTGNGAPWQTAATLGVAGLVVVLVLVERPVSWTRGRIRTRGASSPVGLER